jgi:hypothetical protein
MTYYVVLMREYQPGPREPFAFYKPSGQYPSPSSATQELRAPFFKDQTGEYVVEVRSNEMDTVENLESKYGKLPRFDTKQELFDTLGPEV